MIEGDRPRPARKKEHQHGGPGQMLDPVLRIDEGLDHEDHAQQRQGRQPCQQSDEDQGGAAELAARRQGRRDLRAEHGYPIFIGEEQDRRIPAQDLRMAGFKEDAGHAEAEDQLQDGKRKAAEALGHAFDQPPQGLSPCFEHIEGYHHGSHLLVRGFGIGVDEGKTSDEAFGQEPAERHRQIEHRIDGQGGNSRGLQRLASQKRAAERELRRIEAAEDDLLVPLADLQPAAAFAEIDGGLPPSCWPSHMRSTGQGDSR